jgi:hypothetical protein
MTGYVANLENPLREIIEEAIKIRGDLVHRGVAVQIRSLGQVTGCRRYHDFRDPICFDAEFLRDLMVEIGALTIAFGGPETRAQAIALLTRAREIEPWDDDLLLDLAGLYAGNDQCDLALELLSTLACRTSGAMLRRVRLLQLRLRPSIRILVLWLRACGESAASVDPITNERALADTADTESGRPPEKPASVSFRVTAA